MLQNILKILPYLINLLSGILLACATYTINKARGEREKAKKKEEEKIKALSDGVEALLRESIVTNYNKWSERHYCPIYAKESIKRVHSAYKSLGGNDVATHLYHEILELPTEKEGEQN